MSDSLRRSTRRVPKRSFAVGDIVELSRVGTTAHGRLVIKLSEDPARWLITFDEGNLKDEELAEKALGSIVGKSEEGEVAIKSPDSCKTRNKKKSSPRSKSDSINRSGVSGSSADEHSDSKKKKKIVSFVQEHQPNDTETLPPRDPIKKQKQRPNRSSRVSDREQRSRRRQAMIEEDITIPVTSADNKRPVTHDMLPPKAKKSKTGAPTGDVVKIPMLTGTLYLYRGARRRVEFIRKY